MFISAGDGRPSFEKHRVILPCISVGNVGQLTADLLINTLRLPRVGYLDHPAILPLVGNDAFDHTHQAGSGYLHTAAEVYHSAELKLVVVQLRTPLIKGLREEFCLKLLEWVNEEGMTEAVVLTSSYAHERRDSQIRGEPFRFLLSSSASHLHSHFTSQLLWSPLEPRCSQEDTTPSSSSSPSSIKHQVQGVLQDSHIFLPGAGLSRKLYKESQGDNIQDAVAMAARVDKWLHVNKKEGKSGYEWLHPSSWNMMYGGPSPSNIF